MNVIDKSFHLYNRSSAIQTHKNYYLPLKIDNLLSPAWRAGGDYNLHHVSVYVHACVVQFSLKLLQLHIFGKLLVLMNFYALQYFGGFGELWPSFE